MRTWKNERQDRDGVKEVVKKKQLKEWTKAQKGVVMGEQKRMETAML